APPGRARVGSGVVQTGLPGPCPPGGGAGARRPPAPPGPGVRRAPTAARRQPGRRPRRGPRRGHERQFLARPRVGDRARLPPTELRRGRYRRRRRPRPQRPGARRPPALRLPEPPEVLMADFTPHTDAEVAEM